MTRGFGHYVTDWQEPAELDMPNFTDSKTRFDNKEYTERQSDSRQEHIPCNCPRCRAERYRNREQDNHEERNSEKQNSGRDQNGLLKMLKNMLEGGKFDITALLNSLGNSDIKEGNGSNGFNLASLIPLFTNGTFGNIINLFKSNKKPSNDGGKTINLDNYKRV